jgi:hypothetical protein
MAAKEHKKTGRRGRSSGTAVSSPMHTSSEGCGLTLCHRPTSRMSPWITRT